MKNSEPFVSVVLPTYNRAQSLGTAIQSVLEQTFPDFELIVVDDGSQDDTPSLIKRFNDKRLVYIQRSLNSGISAARNSAIHASRGKMIAFQDSDDEWQAQKLERQIERMKACGAEVGVVYAPFLRVDPNSTKVFPRFDELIDGDIHACLLYRNVVSAQVALVKRECFDKIGLFDEELPCLVDWDLWLRISRDYHFAYVTEPLARVYFTSNSASSNRQNLARALERILQKYGREFRSHPKALAYHQYECGVLMCLSGEFERGQKILFQVAKEYPGRRYYWLAATFSLLGEKIFVRGYSLKSRLDWD